MRGSGDGRESWGRCRGAEEGWRKGVELDESCDRHTFLPLMEDRRARMINALLLWIRVLLPTALMNTFLCHYASICLLCSCYRFLLVVRARDARLSPIDVVEKVGCPKAEGL